MIGFIRLISVGMVLHEVEIGSPAWVEGTKARRGEAAASGEKRRRVYCCVLRTKLG